MRGVRTLSILLAIVLLPATSAAQRTVFGVTWTPPANDERAVAELMEMGAHGVGAVRMPARDVVGSVLAAADSFGIELFLELSPGYLPAERLIDTLAAAQAELYRLAEQVRGHSSVTHIGLSRWPNTSDPTTCIYLDELAKRWSEAGSGAATYFTTAFTTDDVCSGTVDEVYVELADQPPEEVDSAYSAASRHITNLRGIASVGTWIDAARRYYGVLNEHSPEWQARYLEKTLAPFAKSDDAPRAAYIFVHRWTDADHTNDFFGDIRQRQYGVQDVTQRRPAAQVLEGFATGRQQVFAFEPGKRSRFEWRWSTLFGWLAIGVLATMYATSPQMRHMVPRYFLSHGFYCEAIGSGRESLVLETVAVLTAISLGVGLSLTVLLTEVSMLPSFAAVQNWMRPERRDSFAALLDQRWSLMVILASAFSLVYLAWASMMSLLSRRARTLYPSQTLIVVVWTLWPLLALLLVSPAVATLDTAGTTFASMTLIATAVVIAHATLRSLRDYRAITGISVGKLSLVVLLHPLVWASIAAAVVLTGQLAPEVAYFWDLITRA